jgi:U3 small nucleolar RNA-associated protein 18
MLFKESKKRVRQTDEEELKPAWEDKGVGKIKIDINNQSRLRKLKKDEDENVIEGPEFSKRLKK